MEVATCGSGSRSLNHSSWIVGTEKFVTGKPNGFLKFSCNKENRTATSISSQRGGVTVKPKFVDFKRSCLYKTVEASTVGPYSDYHSMDEALILKKKSQDISPYLSGRCIYLVGMMGSGKSTVGKILAEVLGYSFLDSDNLVEQAVGATSVAQIFKQYSEGFFRDNESKVLGELSLMRRLVVATGGGAVIRPINWKYMKKGITVWLDVPLEALARRIAAVGTNSRPLLHNESGDAYTTAYKRLTVLSEERGEVYANADAKVCLQRVSRRWEKVLERWERRRDRENHFFWKSAKYPTHWVLLMGRGVVCGGLHASWVLVMYQNLVQLQLLLRYLFKLRVL